MKHSIIITALANARAVQIVDKVDEMETVENFLRQGTAERRLVSDLKDRDPADLKPETQY